MKWVGLNKRNLDSINKRVGKLMRRYEVLLDSDTQSSFHAIERINAELEILETQRDRLINDRKDRS